MEKKWGVIAAVGVIVLVAAVVSSLAAALSGGAGAELYGEAQGFSGPVIARVSLDASGKIVALQIEGDEGGVPDIAGPAIAALKEEILKKGSIEGVDAVSGATVTSNGVLSAIRAALSGKRGGAGQALARDVNRSEVVAAAITHGLGFTTVGRVTPTPDERGALMYSFNVVIAYALFDGAGRILDLEVDHVEVSTPNFSGFPMPLLTGFPGQSYSGGIAQLTQDYGSFLTQIANWRTKRERGGSYRMPSGTWEQEMDIFEEAFKGMTVAELQEWFAAYCSNINGKPLNGASDLEADIAKRAALSADDLAALDAVSGATMSLNDSHGDIIGAIVKAYEARRPVNAARIAKIGLANTNSGAAGRGADGLGAQSYSFSILAAGVAYDERGRMAAIYTDALEVSTPNAGGSVFTGFPGQSYSDGSKRLEQTEEGFFEQVASWRTKRELGSSYMMPSGSWQEQMDAFDAFFAGMTAQEMSDWFAAYCSRLDGKVLASSAQNEADAARYEALGAEEKLELDALSGATMSLRGEHGDIVGTIEKASRIAKEANIVVN